MTHSRINKTTFKLAVLAKFDKDGNETHAGEPQEQTTHKSINAAKRFMRTLPQHHNGARK